MPKAIIHDGLPSYDKAFQKEYYTLKNPRVKNIRSVSVRNEGLNSSNGTSKRYYARQRKSNAWNEY